MEGMLLIIPLLCEVLSMEDAWQGVTADSDFRVGSKQIP